MLNRTESSFEGEAVIDYGDGDFVILKPGAYVVCAVTGSRIPLDQLRYWHPDRQEAYLDAATAMERWRGLEGAAG